MKDFEKELGFPETKNFQRHKQEVAAYYRCYYTGKLELPASYEELQLKEGHRGGCPIDDEKYDVFFYPIEAVASGNAPVTSSLASASLERLLVVVPHEDFHDHQQAETFPLAFTEAAATLIGFVTAGEFARERFGPTSATYRNLAREADQFLRKAEIINAYYAKLSGLYRSARSGEISRQIALDGKADLLAALQQECEAIDPEPSSFNKCPGAVNNAGLAFDRTYTKHYPLIFELFEAQGRDLKKTVQTIQQPAMAKPQSEAEAAAYLRSVIEQETARAREPQ